jgi:hypothetical protein
VAYPHQGVLRVYTRETFYLVWERAWNETGLLRAELLETLFGARFGALFGAHFAVAAELLEALFGAVFGADCGALFAVAADWRV